jgi:hypothetical protein
LGRFAPWLRTIAKVPHAKAILRFAKKLVRQIATTTLCWVDGGFVIKPRWLPEFDRTWSSPRPLYSLALPAPIFILPPHFPSP